MLKSLFNRKKDGGKDKDKDKDKDKAAKDKGDKRDEDGAAEKDGKPEAAAAAASGKAEAEAASAASTAAAAAAAAAAAGGADSLSVGGGSGSGSATPAAGAAGAAAAAAAAAAESKLSDPNLQKLSDLRKLRRAGVALKMSGYTNMFPDVPLEFVMDDLLKPQPTLAAASANERQSLLVKKLRLCNILFEWDPMEEVQATTALRPDVADERRAKEVKRQLLLEIADYASKNRAVLTEPIIIEMLRMTSANLFRAMPCTDRAAGVHRPGGGAEGGEADEDEQMLEPSWQHLQIVYEIFLRFIVAGDVDIKILKKYINAVFVLHILELFDSEDPRERDYLKTILHRIYAKFLSLRAFIRKAINNTFFSFIYETESYNGVAELLEILGSIINGFALPLKAEHKQFLQRVLLPMHKVRTLPQFHQQLTYCVTQFVHKDSELAVVVIKALLRLWPATNSTKEVLFLNELEEVLDLTQVEEFKAVMVPLFKHIARIIASPHFQVAERVLFFWHNEYISGLIASNREALMPIIYPVLVANSERHWNTTVNSLSGNILNVFIQMDKPLVDKCAEMHAEREAKERIASKQRKEMWKALEDAAAAAGKN